MKKSYYYVHNAPVGYKKYFKNKSTNLFRTNKQTNYTEMLEDFYFLRKVPLPHNLNTRSNHSNALKKYLPARAHLARSGLNSIEKILEQHDRVYPSERDI